MTNIPEITSLKERMDKMDDKIEKLETRMITDKKETTIELKELGGDLKKTIKEEFANCRAIAPLTCPNSKKLSLVQATGLCTVVIGVFIALAKLGLLHGLLAVAAQ